MKKCISLCFALSLLSGCQSNDGPVLALMQRFEPGASQVHYADVSGTPSPAAFRVEIQMPEAFRTLQASQPAAVAGDARRRRTRS